MVTNTMWLPGNGRAGGVNREGSEETFWDDRYAHYLDYGDGLMDIYVCQKSPSLHFKCFIYHQLFFIKLKKRGEKK